MALRINEVKLYKLTEAAKLLDIADSTLRKKIKSGQVQSQLVQGRTHLTQDEVYRLQNEKASRKRYSRA